MPRRERTSKALSGDSKDDELPCVIGESAGHCVWRERILKTGPHLSKLRTNV